MKAKEFDIKKRNPNWRTMQDIRRSGAGGPHQDKKRADKQGDVKHKKQAVPMEEQGVAEDQLNELSFEEIKSFYVTYKVITEWGIPLVVMATIVAGLGIAAAVKLIKQGKDAVIKKYREIKGTVNPDDVSDAAKKIKNVGDKNKDGVSEGIGGMIAGGVGQFIGNKIDPLAGEIMRAHGEIAGRKAEYTIRKYMHLLQKALKQQLDSGEKEGMAEASDFGEPREILEDVLQTLEREVEWPLTEVMDPKEVRQLLSPVVRAVNDKLLSMDRDGNQ